MIGLILAAGKGTRLGKLSETTPKPLIELSTGETLLSRLIRQMFAAGVQDVTIVIGHMGEQVRDHVLKLFPSSSVDFVTAEDFSTTNNVVSMHLGLSTCRTKCQENSTLIFAECDVLLEDGIFEDLIKNKNRNVAVVSQFSSGMDGTVVALRGESISEIIPPRLQTSRFALNDFFKTVNVYKFDWLSWSRRLPRLLEWQIDEIGTSDYYENSIGMVVYSLQSALHAHVIPNLAWHEIDDLNDLRIAEEKLFPGHDVPSVLGSHGGWWDLPYLDFAYLRNMHFPPPAFYAQISDNIPALLQNYGSSQTRVDEKLSWLLNVDAKKLIALPGLSAIYPQLSPYFDNSSTWIPSQTFGEYAHRFPNASRYPDDAWHEVLDKDGVKTVVIVNPNNPTGYLTGSEEILEAAHQSKNVLFIVDESFIAFTTVVSLLQSHKLPENILLLRSLSKEIGMPGLRLGFAYAEDLDLIHRLRALQPVWALNSVAEFATTLLLKFRKEFLNSFDAFLSDRVLMEACLKCEAGVSVKSNVEGPFLLANFARTVYPDLTNALGRYRILVKDLTDRFSRSEDEYTLRLAVRPPADVDCLVQALRNVRANSNSQTIQ